MVIKPSFADEAKFSTESRTNYSWPIRPVIRNANTGWICPNEPFHKHDARDSLEGRFLFTHLGAEDQMERFSTMSSQSFGRGVNPARHSSHESLEAKWTEERKVLSRSTNSMSSSTSSFVAPPHELLLQQRNDNIKYAHRRAKIHETE